MNHDPLLGTLVGTHYRVLSLLRRGGMGAIYLAEQEPLRRQIALKVLLESWMDDETAVRRFELEASAIAQMNHPNIVTLFDYGHTDAGDMFIAMEFLKGVTLREVLTRESRMTSARALGIIESVASGLAEAHRHGIAHRDLKPANLMILDGYDHDFVKILDFGLARSVAAGQSVTLQNVVPGTPNYLAPERINGRSGDLRSDLYSLGALWFELVTGRLPFEAATSIKIIIKHLQEAPPHPNDCGANLPDPVADLMLSLLEKNPEDRPASAEELVRQIKALSGAWTTAKISDMMPAPDLVIPRLQEPVVDDQREIPSQHFGSALGLEPEQKPIALTKRKGGAQGSLVPLDTSEAAVFLLTNIKTAAPTSLLPIESLATASALLASARNHHDVAQVMVRYLQTKFDRTVILDARQQPELLHSAGTLDPDITRELFGDVPFILKWLDEGGTYYGPAQKGRDWTRFYVKLAGHVPGGMLLAALQREGAPAFLIYADHDKETLYANLKDVATLMREAAAALTVLSF